MYRDTLDRAEKEGLNILKLYIAKEVDNSGLTMALSPEEYESVCDRIYVIYTTYRFNINDIIQVLHNAYEDGSDIDDETLCNLCRGVQ